MPAKRVIIVGVYGHRAVFVGVHMDTGAVKRVWLGLNGSLTDNVVVHQPLPGITAVGAVITVFGLTMFRKFAASDLPAAGDYAAYLRSEHSRNDDHNGSLLG